jgi:hypothetical protein
MADLNVGTLNIALTMDTSGLKKALDESNKHLTSMSAQVDKAFKAAGGSLGMFGEAVDRTAGGIKKAFGDDAGAAMQKYAKDIEKTFGLTESKLKGIGQAASSLEGIFKAAGGAISILANPLGKVVALLFAAYEGVKAVVGASSQAGGIGKSGGTAWQEGAKSFSVGWTALFGSKEEKKAQYSAMLSDKDRAAVVKRNAELQQKALAGTMTGDEFDEARRIVDHIPESVLTGGRTKGAGETGGKGTLENLVDTLDKALAKFTTPGVDKATREAEFDLALKNEMALSDAASRSMHADQMAAADLELKQQEELGVLSDALYQAEIGNSQLQLDNIEAANAEAVAQAAAMSQCYRDATDQVSKDMAQAQAESSARWQALGSGQLGTAAGVGGVGGAAMNIVGSAAAGYERTGAVMQGAAQGGEVGGVWGAVIGAIVGLATQTKSFSKLMGVIEGILGGILPILDNILGPIVSGVDHVLDVLNPVFKILGLIGNVLNLLMKPMQSVTDAFGSLFDAIGGLIDSISLGGVTDVLDKSLGNQNDQWGKYSISDWITVVGPLVSELGMEIDKASNGGMTKEERARAAQFAANTGGPSEGALQQMTRMQEEEKARQQYAWDHSTSNPYYQQNLYFEQLAAAEAAQVEAKQAETREANRAAAALKELSDAVYNSAPGYKLAAVMYAATDRAGGASPQGNPFGGG